MGRHDGIHRRALQQAVRRLFHNAWQRFTGTLPAWIPFVPHMPPHGSSKRRHSGNVSKMPMLRITGSPLTVFRTRQNAAHCHAEGEKSRHESAHWGSMMPPAGAPCNGKHGLSASDGARSPWHPYCRLPVPHGMPPQDAEPAGRQTAGAGREDERRMERLRGLTIFHRMA